jgi:hypothetical protein
VATNRRGNRPGENFRPIWNALTRGSASPTRPVTRGNPSRTPDSGCLSPRAKRRPHRHPQCRRCLPLTSMFLPSSQICWTPLRFVKRRRSDFLNAAHISWTPVSRSCYRTRRTPALYDLLLLHSCIFIYLFINLWIQYNSGRGEATAGCAVARANHGTVVIISSSSKETNLVHTQPDCYPHQPSWLLILELNGRWWERVCLGQGMY